MPGWLAAFNTSLIVGSGLALVVGRLRIGRGDRAGHRRAMLAATWLAAAFLVVYVVRWGMYGSIRYTGVGMARTLYLSTLVLHTIAATMVGPLVLVVLAHARAERFDRHRRWARIAFPLWLFAAASGWVVYLFLYG
jgi:putative membrane protein